MKEDNTVRLSFSHTSDRKILVGVHNERGLIFYGSREYVARWLETLGYKSVPGSLAVWVKHKERKSSIWAALSRSLKRLLTLT